MNSQVFDHTSLIRFLETRFGNGRADLVESNITPWRRAVVGDLTTAFDFKTPNASRHLTLPDTSEFKPDNLVRYPDDVPVPPADQELPGQERGVRRARAIPYTLHVDGHASSSVFSIDFKSSGAAAAVFQVRSAGSTDEPRTYTVEAGKQLTDTWDAASGYDLSVFGPNGFLRRFKGGGVSGVAALLDVKASYDERHHEIALQVRNRGADRIKVTVHDAYTSKDTKLSLRPGEGTSEQWSLSRTRGWYDLVISVQGDAAFEYRYAGHLETGEESISDPAMGGLVVSGAAPAHTSP